jgi:prepilin-type N-terminal cleavage/methylation domain-containing protein
MNRMASTRPAHARGFTMVEMLVVLAIVGFMMATIYGTLYSTLKISRDVNLRVSGSKVGPLLLDQVEHDLRGLFAYNIHGKSLLRGENLRIGGMDADKLSFVSQVPSTTAWVEDDKSIFASVNEVSYGLSQNPENSDYLLLWRGEDFFVDDEPLKGAKGTPLYRRVTGFNVVYYRELGEDAEKFDDWDPAKEKSLPAAIEVTLSMEVDPSAVAGYASGEPERQTHTFTRWIVFNQSMPLTMAVRPKVPALGVTEDEGGDAAAGDKDKDETKNGKDKDGPSKTTFGSGKGGKGSKGGKGKGGKGGQSGGLDDIFGGIGGNKGK